MNNQINRIVAEILASVGFIAVIILATAAPAYCALPSVLMLPNVIYYLADILTPKSNKQLLVEKEK